MSKIAVLVGEEAPARLLLKLGRETGLGLSVIKSRIQNQEPVFEPELFMNDHPEVAGRLRRIMAASKEHQVELKLFELEPKESFRTAPLEQSRITTEVLENILAEAESEFS